MKRTGSAEAIQEDLFNLLGVEGMELMGQLLQVRRWCSIWLSRVQPAFWIGFMTVVVFFVFGYWQGLRLSLWPELALMPEIGFSYSNIW